MIADGFPTMRRAPLCFVLLGSLAFGVAACGSGQASSTHAASRAPFFIGSPTVLPSGQAVHNQWPENVTVYITSAASAVGVKAGPSGNTHVLITIPPHQTGAVRLLADRWIILSYQGPPPAWVWDGG
jgi:hypothetical protein